MFPIVQDQWFNLFLLNEFEFSYYSILYFLSGFLFPILVINSSLSNFYDYKFFSNKYQSNKFKFVSFIVILNILILSLLIIKYFTISVEYIIPQIDLNIYLDNKLKILLFLIVNIFLLINKTKRLIKKLFLINFFIICFVNWSVYFFNLQGIEIYIIKYISNNFFYNFNNLNILNILYLFIIEIFYYVWSYISYQNNLSDWSITYPIKVDLIPLFKITIFYSGVLTYYFIFNIVN